MGARPHDPGGPWRNFYGRIKGKAMNKVQQVRLETQLKSLSPGPVSYEENPHRNEAEQADLIQGYGPRKQKRDLEVENDEQDRDEVIAHVETHARVLKRLETALVWRELLCVLLTAAERKAQA